VRGANARRHKSCGKMVYMSLLLIIYIAISNNIKPQKAIYKYVISTCLCTFKNYKVTFDCVLSKDKRVNKTNKLNPKDLFIYVYKLCLK